MFHFFYSLCSCCVFCKTIKWSRNQETQGKFQVLIKMFQHPAGHGFSSFCTWKINIKSLFSSNISASGKLRWLKLASSQILTSTCTVSQSVMFSNAGNENHSAELWSLIDYSEHVFFLIYWLASGVFVQSCMYIVLLYFFLDPTQYHHQEHQVITGQTSRSCKRKCQTGVSCVCFTATVEPPNPNPNP